jgi:hypothetical protein
VFRAWEPSSAVGAENVFWWVVSYAIAVSIDGTVIWLSHTAAVSRREKTASGGYLFGLWSFILFLTGFSWLMNWMYAKHNSGSANTALSGAITESIAGIQMATITPIMVSMFPVLAIMFTLMADKVVATKVLTAQELQDEADRLEGLEAAQSRINAPNLGYKQRTKKSFIQVAKETVIEAKEAVNEIRSNEQVEDMNNASEISPEAVVEEAINPPAEDEIPVVEQPLPEVNNDVQTDVQTTSQTVLNDEVLAVLEAYPMVASEWLAKNRKSVTLDEIITVTGQSKRRLNRVSFARSSRNKELILVSSIIDWLKTAPKPEPKTVNTDEMESVSKSNGHRKTTTPLPDLAEMEI